MNAYVLLHDDRMYDMGSTYIRGIYVHKEHADFALVSRTPSGAKSRAYDAHDEHCCTVEEYELQDRPDVDIKADLSPVDPKDSVVPLGFVDELARMAAPPSPLRER